MSSYTFKNVKEEEYIITSTKTLGVVVDKYSGYSVPTVIPDDLVSSIVALAEEHNAKNPLYGNTLYLKAKNLSTKQKAELLKKGKQNITIHFKLTSVSTKNLTSYLQFKITKLLKLDDDVDSDSFPED